MIRGFAIERPIPVEVRYNRTVHGDELKEDVMATIELDLDEPTIERARRLAAERNLTVSDLVKEALERLQPSIPTDDPIIGMFADCPEAVDEMLADVMNSRQKMRWRVE
jgi:hypothetical protein